MYPDTLHIALAEDDADDRLFFKEAFDEIKLKHTLSVFEDGVALMDYLHDTDVLPHIVFLDLNMPVKSGLACLKEIRADKRLREMSVAIYSTLVTDCTKEETFIAGANIYIKKPNDFNVLKKILAEVISINWQYVIDGLDRENFMLNY